MVSTVAGRRLRPRRRKALIAILLTILLTRSAPLEQVRALAGHLARWRRARKMSSEERRRRQAETPLNTPALEKKMFDLYISNPSGSRTLLVPHNGRVSKVEITPTPRKTFAQDVKHFPPLRPGEKLGVNKRFWQMLLSILRIAFPSKTGKEAVLLVLHTFFLVARTVLSVMVAKLDGRIVRALVSANGKDFLRGLAWWFALAVPSTYTNSMIRFLERKLSLAFRTNLTRYIHDLYLNDKLNYYKFSLGLGGVPILTNTRKDGGGASEASTGGADQFITTDLARFCDSLAALYGNVGKPALDLVIFTSQLAASLGPLGSVGLFTSYGITAWILRRATPSFGKMAAVQAKLEGEYRAGLSRIGRDGEEIAFYNGGEREMGILRNAYSKVAEHVHGVFRARRPYGMTEDFVIKYLWSACGYGLMSIPILTSRGHHHEVASRTESYVSNRRLLLSLADAGGRLMYSGKDLAELSGYTSRVYALLSSLHGLEAGIYPDVDHSDKSIRYYDMANISGLIEINQDKIILQDVPIVAPAGGIGAERGGEELIKSLDLTVELGQHTLITGPNGVGKTSIARIIAELWPTWSGVLEKPLFGETGVFYLPQRPYLCIGNLRDQVIYPHTCSEMKEHGRTDEDLYDILKLVHLEYLPGREGGWDTRKEWKDVLSGGEKQRMGVARLFYHRPSFAILDECTSAVSSDVEGLMYEQAKNMGITLITISHRPSLLKYHTRHLRLGEMASTTALALPRTASSLRLAMHGWQMTKVANPSVEEQLELDMEIEHLDKILNQDVNAWQKRLKEVNSALKGEA